MKRSCLLKSSMPIRLAPCLHQPRQCFPRASFSKTYVHRKIALDRPVEFPVQSTAAKMRNVQPVGYLPNRSALGPEVCDYVATLVCRLPAGTVGPQDGIHRKHQTGGVSPCRTMPYHCSAGNGCHYWFDRLDLDGLALDYLIIILVERLGIGSQILKLGFQGAKLFQKLLTIGLEGADALWADRPGCLDWN